MASMEKESDAFISVLVALSQCVVLEVAWCWASRHHLALREYKTVLAQFFLGKS